MCNDYRNHVTLDRYYGAMRDVNIRLVFPSGRPNLEPRDDIRITDRAPIIRALGGGEAELTQMRWSWPAPNGKPVYNFRSEGRRFTDGRCLIPADGFYEFTAPPEGSPKSARKTKWLFTKPDEDVFCIAGIWRATPVGEAFTMLTTSPGPDVAPYHDRQIVVLDRSDWAAWLDPAHPAEPLLRSLPAGSLRVEPTSVA